MNALRNTEVMKITPNVRWIKMKVGIILLLLAINCLSSSMEGVKVDSSKTYEIIKQKKLTKIIEVSKNGKSRKEIFSKIIRGSVRWIHYSSRDAETIIITRPMIEGPEASVFWKSHGAGAILLGKTNCLDHSIVHVSSTEIKYNCFSDDPKNPLNELEKRIVFTLE